MCWKWYSIREKEIEFMCAKVFYVFCHRDARSLFHRFIIYWNWEYCRISIERELHFNFALEKICLVMCGKVYYRVIKWMYKYNHMKIYISNSVLYMLLFSYKICSNVIRICLQTCNHIQMFVWKLWIDQLFHIDFSILNS